MIRRSLRTLRTKPKHVRDNLALIAAGSVTALVAIAWFLVTPDKGVLDGVTPAEDPQAFATFFDQLSEQVASVKEAAPTVATSTANNPGSTQAASTSSAPAPAKEAVLFVVPSASSSVLGTTSEPSL